MKATELMIGDWVRIAPYDIIDQVDCLLTEYAVTIHGDTCGQYEYKDLEPILLTGEILEKNEFELKLRDEFGDGVYLINQDMCRYKRWILKNYDITVYFDKKEKKFSIEIDWNNIEHFMYVHELQHALRMCGIKKEIEL